MDEAVSTARPDQQKTFIQIINGSGDFGVAPLYELIERLHDNVVAIAIDDETWQQIGFGVDDAIGVGILYDATTVKLGGVEAKQVERVINRLAVRREEAERDLMQRSADTLEKITGVRPVGLRTPSWDFSQHTLELEREMGLLYDSSLMADEDCYELILEGEPTGVVELPVEWVRDDAVYFLMHRFQSLRPQMPVEAVFDIFRREFDAAYEDGGICQITTHPHIIGYRSRIWIIEELIRHAKSRPGVWFATHAQVAAYAKEHAE